MGRRRISPLLVLCVAQFILQLDFSIVNVALETISRDLGFSETGLQWVASGYALAFGSLLLLCGRLGDVVGRRRLLLAGLGLFGLASLACGLASSPGTLIAARFLQGVGAAMVAPMTLSILTAIYADGRERSRALGIWTAALALGARPGSSPAGC